MERGEVDEAQTLLEETLSATPVNSNAWNTLGSVHRQRREFELAADAFRNAIRYDPWHVAARVNLAVLESGFGRIDLALRELRDALAIDPSFVPAHQVMGLLQAGLGDPAAAIVHLRLALESDPANVLLLTTLARILATTDPLEPEAIAEAKTLATRACELVAYNQPQPLDVLALAYAADGDPASAIRYAERALALARQAGDQALASRIDARLRRYRAGRPVQESAPAGDNP
jgi:tetratricopeptide (TPR) repeat protein